MKWNFGIKKIYPTILASALLISACSNGDKVDSRMKSQVDSLTQKKTAMLKLQLDSLHKANFDNDLNLTIDSLFELRINQIARKLEEQGQ